MSFNATIIAQQLFMRGVVCSVTTPRVGETVDGEIRITDKVSVIVGEGYIYVAQMLPDGTIKNYPKWKSVDSLMFSLRDAGLYC